MFKRPYADIGTVSFTTTSVAWMVSPAGVCSSAPVSATSGHRLNAMRAFVSAGGTLVAGAAAGKGCPAPTIPTATGAIKM